MLGALSSSLCLLDSVEPPRREQRDAQERVVCHKSQTSNDVAFFTVGLVSFGPQDKLRWYDARSPAVYPPPSLLREYVPRQVDNAEPSLAVSTPCDKTHRFLWPFDQSSIWNTAIGSGAKYLPAEIYADELPSEIHNDQEWIIRAREGDPLADWQDDSGDFPGLCNATGARCIA